MRKGQEHEESGLFALVLVGLDAAPRAQQFDTTWWWTCACGCETDDESRD